AQLDADHACDLVRASSPLPCARGNVRRAGVRPALRFLLQCNPSLREASGGGTDPMTRLTFVPFFSSALFVAGAVSVGAQAAPSAISTQQAAPVTISLGDAARLAARQSA